MAERRGKISLSYWPCDCTFFKDIRIKKLVKYQGGKAPLVYIHLLCSIYGEYGYYAEWDDELPFAVSYELGSGYEEGYVSEVIKTCVQIGLFDAGMFEKGVLTSLAIQQRYVSICQSFRRKCVMDKYNLVQPTIPFPEPQPPEQPQESLPPLNVADNGLNATIKDENAEDKQERKGKETIIPPISDEIAPPCENDADPDDLPVEEATPEEEKPKNLPAKRKKSLDERRAEFRQSLIPYREKYGDEMVDAFAAYWTEVNDGGLKMKWEITRDRGGTFSIAGRFATWKKNEAKFGPRTVPKRGMTIVEAIQSVSSMVTPQPPEIDITKMLQNG